MSDHAADHVRPQDSEAVRLERWSKLCDDPTICNANAYAAVVWCYDDVDPHTDSLCRQDATMNGHCWCGKLQIDGGVCE